MRLGAILLIGLFAISTGFVRAADTAPSGIMCAQDAKQCPDGSYVSRTGPACEFAACPSVIVDDTYLQLSRDLKLGSRGSDVIILQEYLVGHSHGPAVDALADAGATGYFGRVTRSALAEFQVNVGITPAQGYFGPITRRYIQNDTIVACPSGQHRVTMCTQGLRSVCSSRCVLDSETISPPSSCGSQGSCWGGAECPSGTTCSGLPAYGCYPAGCPVPL